MVVEELVLIPSFLKNESQYHSSTF